jgi:hypothetical protein
MAWVDVPGTYHAVSNTHIWEYDNAPTLGTLVTGAVIHPDDQYYRANGTVTNGIRSFTPPGGSAQETYVRVRKKDDPAIERGELSKTYYDARV